MKNLLTFTLCLLLNFSAFAQNGVIKGKIVDNNDMPQEFVNILLLDAVDSSLTKGAVTNFDGEFEFEKIQNGQYFISATMVGFNDINSELFEIKNNEVNLGSLVLTEGVELGEVTVTAKKPFIEMKADKIIVNVENSSVNSGNSALEVLEKSPGITLDKDNILSLRGKQGVLVLINGKNQYMSGDELVRMLESMPSENIQSIEIIANPSAKYDAEGNSGIINIRLKKNENFGYNGSVNAGFRQGIKTTYNTGLDFNYRANKINIFGSGSFYDWGSYQDLYLDRIVEYNGGTTVFDQLAMMDNFGLSFNGRVGMDYSLTDNTTIGILYKNNSGSRNSINDNMTLISGDNSPNFDILEVLSGNKGGWNQQSYNFNLLHNLSNNGATVSFDADYSNYGFEGLNTYDNLYQTADEIPLYDYYLRNNLGTQIDIFASTLDFSTPLASGYKLDFGGKVSMVRTNNDTKFEALENNTWEDQPNRTNNFIYSENVLAAYANGSKSFGKVTVQVGLRLEHTISEGNSVTLDQVVPLEYTNLFPSFSVSHPIGEKHSLSYTYSKRLNRPNYRDLNPFIEYLDDYTFQMGNPFLRPQFSDAVGINYGYGSFLFVSANYSYTKDAITQVIEQFSDQNTSFQTNSNLDNFNSASLTVTTPIPWKSYGTTRISFTGFYNDFQSVIPSGILDNQSFGYNLYVGNQFNLPAGISMELNGNYRSGLVYGIATVQQQYGIDLGFSRSILKGKGNIKIGLDDVFRTRINAVSIIQDDINLNILNINDTRRVKLNMTYKFGNSKVKSARRRSTATEDESSRINSGN